MHSGNDFIKGSTKNNFEVQVVSSMIDAGKHLHLRVTCIL